MLTVVISADIRRRASDLLNYEVRLPLRPRQGKFTLPFMRRSSTQSSVSNHPHKQLPSSPLPAVLETG